MAGKDLSRLQTVEISTDAGATWTLIGRVKGATRSSSTSSADMTDNDSGGFEESKPNRESWSLSIPFNYDESDAGQEKLVNAKANKTTVKWRWRLKGGGTGNRQWVGDGWVESLDENGSGDAADATATVRGTGQPVPSIQT